MNDTKRVERLFRAHAEELLAYLRTFRLPEDETYDLVQTAFVRLIETGPATVREPRPWLYAVGRNLALNALRRGRGRVDLEAIPERTETEPGPLEALLADEENRRLWGFFGDLPPEDRELLRLHIGHGLSHAEVGRIVGRTAGAVKVAIHRARARLKGRRDAEPSPVETPGGAVGAEEV